MKKYILLTSIITLLSFAFGFWTNKKYFSHEESVVTEKDTAEINRQIKLEYEYPIYNVQGGIPNQKDKYRYIVCKWYNFRFRVNGNCTDSYSNEITFKQNLRAEKILKKRFGEDWNLKFEKSVDSLFRIDSLSIVIAENDKRIQNLIKSRLKNETANQIGYKCYPTTDDNLKIVSFEWTGKIYKDSTSVSYLRAVINLKEKTVIEIEKTEKEGSNYMFY